MMHKVTMVLSNNVLKIVKMHKNLANRTVNVKILNVNSQNYRKFL